MSKNNNNSGKRKKTTRSYLSLSKMCLYMRWMILAPFRLAWKVLWFIYTLCRTRKQDGKEFNKLTNQPDLGTIQYKTVMLGTAQYPSFNIHLIQGDLNNLDNKSLKVEFCPMEKGDTCTVDKVAAENCMVICLPPWCSFAAADNFYNHFKKLRKSLETSVSEVLDYAKSNEYSVVAVTTANIHNATYPFPADAIAKVLINQLFNKFGKDENTQKFEIFLCEPTNEAFSKAFRFFLQLKSVHVINPNQDSWDQVYSYDSVTSNSALLKSRNVSVEVIDKNPSWGDDVTLFCYPIQPSLEANTCPVIHENFSVKKLESTIGYILKEHPDGLLLGETFELKGFSDQREAIVYCCPVWGWDCEKVIQAIVKQCLKKVPENFKAVHIIPPGLHVLPQYPMTYLVQTFYRELFNFLENEPFKNKRIVLIVCDPKYKKKFEAELQKI